MINKYKKIYNNALFIAVLSVLFFSCEGTDVYETFDEFVDENQSVVSVASPLSIAIPSIDEAKVFVAINADPKIAKAVVEWDVIELVDGQNAVVRKMSSLDINRTVFTDEIFEIIIPLAEGIYAFDVYLEDASGTRSKSVVVNGEVFGSEYLEDLQSRTFLDNITTDDVGVTTITWNDVSPDSLLLWSELKYVDSNGVEQVVIVANDDSISELPDTVPGGTFFVSSTYALSMYTDLSDETAVSQEIEGAFPM